MPTPKTTEKILVYLGPSLPLAQARRLLPQAIYRPPAKQGDIVSDVINYRPNRIILIDGVFRENLSPWHKEIVFALQYPGVKAIYGSASMGALRAAELDYLGMVGIGRIYQWYRDGVTEDESEVAVSYAERDGAEGTVYYLNNVPLVDIRAGVEAYSETNQDLAGYAAEFLQAMRKVFYMDRTRELCQQYWSKEANGTFPCVSQKAADAVLALSSYLSCESPTPIKKPAPEHLSTYFNALYERDRRIRVNGIGIVQQHIDAYVLLHNPEWERICWDSSNQELALLLCDTLSVMVTLEEIERESQRFQQRAGLKTEKDFDSFLASNGWSRPEYDRLMIQNARIRKLQAHLTVSKMCRHNTQANIDYLRTHQAFDYWAVQAAKIEERLHRKGTDDWLSISLETPVMRQLSDHFEQEGLELNSTAEEYLLQTGFSNFTELSVALQRTRAAKEDD